MRGWRVLVAVVAAVSVAGCDGAERLEILADGSATLASSVTVSREDPFFDAVVQLDYDEWTALAREDPRAFIEDALALDPDDPILDQSEVDVGQDRTTITVTRAVDSLDELADALAEGDGRFANRVLAGSVITDADTAITLTVDAVGNLNDYWTELFALADGTSVFDLDEPLGDLELIRGSTYAVEFDLPGRILDHDAHHISGNTLRWSWTIGEQSQPGITVTWDPSGDPDSGFNWSGRGAVMLYALAALLALAAVIAARATRPAGAAKPRSAE